MDLGGLDTVIRKVGRFPELPLAALAFQVLWGLGYMQVEKRVHRDIKPANILCASDGSAKLTDFGEEGWPNRANSMALAAWDHL